MRSSPRCSLWVLTLVWCGLTTADLRAQIDPGLAKTAQAEARSWIDGDAAARQRLMELGPGTLPVIHEMFASSAERQRLDGLIDDWVAAALDRSIRDEQGLIYHGQFAALKPLGVRGARRLMTIFRDEDARREIRTRAAMAIGDIGDPSLLPDLRQMVDDFLSEEWVVEDAGFLMARLGERSYVDRRLQQATKIAAQAPTTSNLPLLVGAHTDLAQIYYRTGEYKSAVKHYSQKRAILGDLRSRVRPELALGIDDEVALLDYNLACSLSLAGLYRESFEALKRAMPHVEVTVAMVRADGDLRGLRSQPGFPEWLRELEGLDTVPEKPDGAESPQSDG